MGDDSLTGENQRRTLSRTPTQIELSSSLAAGQRALRDDALGGVMPAGVTAVRRFARGDTLTAFAEAYTDDRMKPADVRVTATLERARGGRMFSGAATAVDSEPGRLGYTASIPLTKLAPGEYVLTIEARAGRRTASQQVPLAVVD